MSALQAVRHTAGLVMASFGGFGILFTLGMAALAFEDRNRGREIDIARLFGCSASLLLASLLLVWRGLLMRRRAIAAGSTIHIDADRWVQESHWTSRSGSPRPSFLQEKPDAEEQGTDEAIT